MRIRYSQKNCGIFFREIVINSRTSPIRKITDNFFMERKQKYYYNQFNLTTAIWWPILTNNGGKKRII